jgi:hypothetical protein
LPNFLPVRVRIDFSNKRDSNRGNFGRESHYGRREYSNNRNNPRRDNRNTRRY